MPRVTWMDRKPAKKVNYMAALFRAYRQATKMTAADIAKQVGCSEENARCQMCKPADEWRIGHLKRYCDALGIPYSEAFEAAGK